MVKKLILLVMFCLASVECFGSEVKNVFILVDLSDSPLHITSAEFAKKVANYVDEKVLADLALGSSIHICSFGEYNRAKNLVSFSFVMLKKNGQRPGDVRSSVQLLLENIPVLVKKNVLSLQKETNLIGELKILAQQLNYAQANTVVIISDMLEFSDDADCYTLVQRSKGNLPENAPGILNGVEIIAIGAGQGTKNSKQNDRLQVLWTNWFRHAKAKSFLYLTYF